MHPTNGFLQTVIERVRGYLDHPTVDSKFVNNVLIAHDIMPCMVEVIGRLNLTQENPVVLRYTIDFEQDVERYDLPPCIGGVHQLSIINDSGEIISDFKPERPLHPRGPGWLIEGNQLIVRPFPASAFEADIWYTSNGDMLAHYAADGNLDADRDTLTLGTPSLGAKDLRSQAYAGQFLRIIQANVIEERIIATHDPVAGTVTTRTAFSSNVTTGANKTYEIVPLMPQSQAFYDAVATRAAMKAGVKVRITMAQRQMLKEEYLMALKTCGDNLTNLLLRTPHRFNKNTIDNPDAFMPRLPGG